jgi:BirA family biotin operon repressor/biotin-[acetyl-CoA-carboxylase] ligase
MKLKLLDLLSEDTYVSGEIIAQRLNVSRTAVWKQIKVLRDLGYNIDSVKNKGYRLISKPDIPIEEEVTRNLKTKIIGKKIQYFKTINSTNLYARKLLEKNIEEGTVVVADIQTHGRGRKKRTWSSPSGGLWFSVILYPNIPPQNAMLITMASSVAVAQGIQEVTGLKPVIKWPNDLLLNNKKVCGILTELDAEIDKLKYIVVGIGINVNNPIDIELKDIGISLFQEARKKLSRVNLLKVILKNLDELYHKLNSEDYNFIRELWFSYSKIIGKEIRVTTEKSNFTGIVTNIDDNGSLILETKDGFIKIVSGDIEYL